MRGVGSKRIAIYSRFSSDKQSDASIEDQVHRSREWIRTQGGEPDAAQVFSDYAISGASMERPGMRALELEVRSGRIDVLVTESVDRLSRDVGDADRFRKLLEHHSVDLVCLDGTRVTAGDKSGSLLFGVRAIFAEQYRADLADKTLRGLEGRARLGLATGAAPYGYRNVPRAEGGSIVEVDPDRAAITRRIFELYAAGNSFAGIASQLNAEGITPPRAHSRRSGNGWMHTAVRSILLNERYRGVWAFGEREWRKAPGTNRRVPRERKSGALVTTKRPDMAIIDEALWATVQARFERAPRMPGKRRAYALSGLVYCGMCGGRLHVTGPADRPHFGCVTAQKRGMCTNRRNVRVGKVETAVFETLEATLLACMGEVREIVEEEIRIWASTVGDRSIEQRRELREADRKIANLVEALADSSSPALKAKLRELEDRRAELTRVLTGADSRVTVLPSAAEITRRVLAIAELREAPADLAREQLRLMTRDGRINVTPMPDRSFEVAGAANPAALLNPYTRSGLAASGCWEVVVAGAGFVDFSTVVR